MKSQSEIYQKIEWGVIRRLEVISRWIGALDLNPDMRRLVDDAVEELRDFILQLGLDSENADDQGTGYLAAWQGVPYPSDLSVALPPGNPETLLVKRLPGAGTSPAPPNRSSRPSATTEALLPQLVASGPPGTFPMARDEGNPIGRQRPLPLACTEQVAAIPRGCEENASPPTPAEVNRNRIMASFEAIEASDGRIEGYASLTADPSEDTLEVIPCPPIMDESPIDDDLDLPDEVADALLRALTG